ncbi:MAG: hypothetical protein FH762_05095 [Firmicutes bacterium]|nr:hypothetical protein [Bacillota bacterium]
MLFFNTSYTYILMSLVVAGLALILIPKKEYKHYFLYGMIFGGVGEVIVVTFLRYIGLVRYRDMGSFNILGLFPFWTPLTGMFVFMIFFYLLPVRKGFLITYIICFSALNYGTGLMLNQLGLFEYVEIYLYIAPFISILWYSLAAHVYFRSGGIRLK